VLSQSDVEGADAEVDLGDALGWEDFREGGLHLIDD
jgi:hypothetical protein